MKLKNWLKVTVVTIIIMTFIFSYSLFFIDFAKLGQQSSQQQFQGPQENPPDDPEGDASRPYGAGFQLPTEAPSSERPNKEPPK